MPSLLRFSNLSSLLLYDSEVGVDVVDDLRKDPRPVDGVNSPKTILLMADPVGRVRSQVRSHKVSTQQGEPGFLLTFFLNSASAKHSFTMC